MAGDCQTRRSRYLPPRRTILGMLLSSLIMVLLPLEGAVLIEETSTGSNVSTRTCLTFQVGSPRAGTTRIHLENRGPNDINVRIDKVDDTGVIPGGTVLNRSMGPWTVEDVAFRTPVLGTAVKVVSTRANLYAATHILFDKVVSTDASLYATTHILFDDDEASGESRPAVACSA